MKGCNVYNNHTINSMSSSTTYEFKKPSCVYYDPNNVYKCTRRDIICTTTGPMEGEVPAGDHIYAYGSVNDLKNKAYRLGFRVLRSLVVSASSNSRDKNHCYATHVVPEHQLDELINEQNPSSSKPSSYEPPLTSPPSSKPSSPSRPSPPSYTKFAS